MEERRNQYFCGSQYVTLESVHKDWKQDVSSPKIGMWQGDITKLEVDAIVNAANSGLKAGGRVCGAIHRAAGSQLQKECDSIGGCPVGDSRITAGYKLPAKLCCIFLLHYLDVIHTVGPQDKNSEHLKSCYRKSMELLIAKGLRSIAFPCISTGIYGYPSDKAAEVALQTIRSFIQDNSESVDSVIFCVFLDKDMQYYSELLSKK
uniref:MACRO domain-containing protein 1 n=1 Tax=Caligus rogercresseyi TaxID=217165 RepID=C1BP09_CALRO|nr:MACRO domain-containing protein 1 [Caligus rogercresseyi]